MPTKPKYWSLLMLILRHTKGQGSAGAGTRDFNAGQEGATKRGHSVLRAEGGRLTE